MFSEQADTTRSNRRAAVKRQDREGGAGERHTEEGTKEHLQTVKPETRYNQKRQLKN